MTSQKCFLKMALTGEKKEKISSCIICVLSLLTNPSLTHRLNIRALVGCILSTRHDRPVTSQRRGGGPGPKPQQCGAPQHCDVHARSACCAAGASDSPGKLPQTSLRLPAPAEQSVQVTVQHCAAAAVGSLVTFGKLMLQQGNTSSLAASTSASA